MAQLQQKSAHNPCRGHPGLPGTVILTPSISGHCFQDQEIQLTYLLHRKKHREPDKKRRQRNIFQLKEQDKMPKKLQNETEINSLPDKEFKVMVIKVLTGLERGVDKLREGFNQEVENTKKNQSEPKKTITEMKNTLGVISSRLEDVR